MSPRRSLRPSPFEGVLVDAVEIAAWLGCGPKHVRRMAETGVIPAGIRIGKRAIRWRKSDIDEWLKARVTEVNLSPVTLPPDPEDGSEDERIWHSEKHEPDQ